MKTINQTSMLIFAVLLITFTNCTAQIKSAKTEAVNIYGNCDMCKTNIETASYKKRISSAAWDKESKTAILTYDSTKTTVDAILKNIALAGYDNQKFYAPDDAYNKLDMCCQYARNQQKEVKQTGETEGPKDDTSAKPSTQTGNPLNNVYNSYFALKDALIKTDGTAAGAKANELFKAIDDVPMEKLNTEQHTVWMKNMKQLSYDAEHIKGTTEIEHQREHFAKLSTTIYEIIKVIKPEYTVYLDNCPMYNDGKGANWLSKESEIKNPYYGNQMLTCGSTKDAIKAKE